MLHFLLDGGNHETFNSYLHVNLYQIKHIKKWGINRAGDSSETIQRKKKEALS
jgi:hypothetical protein